MSPKAKAKPKGRPRASTPHNSDGGVKTNGAAKQKAGDWKCMCGFESNWQSKSSCFSCKKARSSCEVRAPRASSRSAPVDKKSGSSSHVSTQSTSEPSTRPQPVAKKADEHDEDIKKEKSALSAAELLFPDPEAAETLPFRTRLRELEATRAERIQPEELLAQLRNDLIEVNSNIEFNKGVLDSYKLMVAEYESEILKLEAKAREIEEQQKAARAKLTKQMGAEEKTQLQSIVTQALQANDLAAVQAALLQMQEICSSKKEAKDDAMVDES